MQLANIQTNQNIEEQVEKEKIMSEYELYFRNMLEHKYENDSTALCSKHKEIINMVNDVCNELKEVKKKMFFLTEKRKRIKTNTPITSMQL